MSGNSAAGAAQLIQVEREQQDKAKSPQSGLGEACVSRGTLSD
jgi:hypothetical protein